MIIFSYSIAGYYAETNNIGYYFTLLINQVYIRG